MYGKTKSGAFLRSNLASFFYTVFKLCLFPLWILNFNPWFSLSFRPTEFPSLRVWGCPLKRPPSLYHQHHHPGRWLDTFFFLNKKSIGRCVWLFFLKLSEKCQCSILENNPITVFWLFVWCFGGKRQYPQ